MMKTNMRCGNETTLQESGNTDFGSNNRTDGGGGNAPTTLVGCLRTYVTILVLVAIWSNAFFLSTLPFEYSSLSRVRLFVFQQPTRTVMSMTKNVIYSSNITDNNVLGDESPDRVRIYEPTHVTTTSRIGSLTRNNQTMIISDDNGHNNKTRLRNEENFEFQTLKKT